MYLLVPLSQSIIPIWPDKTRLGYCLLDHVPVLYSVISAFIKKGSLGPAPSPLPSVYRFLANPLLLSPHTTGILGGQSLGTSSLTLNQDLIRSQFEYDFLSEYFVILVVY